MRRRYRSSKSPRKEFINSYHVNEVPLPYYNPLEDPFLKGFFTNYHVSRVIEDRGLLYKARKEYPYEERRLTNHNKFLRSNSYMIPSANLLRHREDLLQRAKSFNGGPVSEHQSTSSHLVKKMSDSDFFSKSTGKFTDTTSRRPSTTHNSQRSEQHEKGIVYKKGISSKGSHGLSVVIF
jgi:hypothetical protein